MAEGIDRAGAVGQAEVGMRSLAGGWRFHLMVRRQGTMRRAVRRLGDDRAASWAEFDILTRRIAENCEGPRRRYHLVTACPL